MSKSVIRNEKIAKHNVEAYRFKVLKTQLEPSSNDVDEVIEEFVNETTPPKNTEVQLSEPVHQVSEVSKIQDDSFVEKLLKKTDELSSENIKLQMQNEKQKEEFEREIVSQVEAAKEEALQEGYKKSKIETEDLIKNLQEQYKRSCSLLDEKLKILDDFIQNTQKDLSEIAIEIAKEVIQKELSTNSSEIALALSKSLMKELSDCNKMEIRVNPKDFPLLNESFQKNERLKIISDEAIVQGGIIILSDVGNIDGSVKTRMDKIIQLTKE